MSRLTLHTVVADVLESLPHALREIRERRGMSIRSAAKEIGINFATVSRIEAGRDHRVDNVIAVLRWLDHRPEEHDATMEGRP
ncbi:Helix-turn-helix domain-containing protein [Amycolatopsis pretoriensis]|uniref:Helix-turn-helix domain-containing protein n=1 Tax=Amycolatopsis pretoriensis TaxID=218821 RepID=A0A1H5R8E9_9PSEU|nr:helix-turn-helix transcriptional regulator [Amycolatopsis pretoriensis]SEF34344.1 Helix-turn-helix domain-containing protein [Amycolatopsis pretoriensis]